MGILDKAIERLGAAIVKASPTVTQYTQAEINATSVNQQGFGNSVGLPRDPGMANVPFTPGQAIIPGAINPLRADGRPDPRRYEYQVAQNINITETRLVPFKTLRAAADQIDIVRRCIEVIKNKTAGLEWDIVLGNDAVEQVMAETGETNRVRALQLAQTKFNDEISRARKFWEKPDPSNGLGFGDWLMMALEEILVLDAWAVWPQRSVKGDLLGLQILDGSTIKPLIDDRGMRPTPPFPAYQQILYGFPRSEFAAPTETEDVDGEFSSDELQYLVRNRRTHTVYGYSPTERSLNLADIYLRRQQWLRAEYTDGVIPELLFRSDANFGNSPDLLRAYENVLNDELSGQTEQRKRARILPAGLDPIQMDGYGERFKNEMDMFLIESICGHFGVMPTEIGYAPKGGLGGSGHQQGQAQTSEVAMLVPLQTWISQQLSQLSYVFLGMPRVLEFRLMPSKRADDLASAQVDDLESRNGGLTLNERRSAKGLSLIDAPEADQPIMVLGSTAYLVTTDGLVPVGGADVDATPNPENDATSADASTEPVEPAVEPVDKSARNEAKAFIRWLKKSPDRAFEFKYLPEAYSETLNKFVAVADFEGARWYAERYLA